MSYLSIKNAFLKNMQPFEVKIGVQEKAQKKSQAGVY